MTQVRAPVHRFMLAAAMTAALTGCADKPQHFNLDNVTGSMPDLRLFGAENTEGKVPTAASYDSTVVVLYFGYTHCPNVCPLTLTKLHDALKKLGDKAAKKVQVLFVTVDPKRDRLPLLRAYVHAFDPRFDALRATGVALDSLTRRYHVAYSYGKPDASGDYTVNHSAGVYVFDGSGKLRLVGTTADSAESVAEDLGKLTASQRSWW